MIESEVLTLVPRVTSFANQYVTKADGYDPYSDAEKRITSLAVLVFDSEGKLVHIEEASNASNLTLNKSMLNIEGATLVMFANTDIAALKSATNLTLTSLETYALTNASPVITAATIEDANFKGLPMMGRLEDVDLTPTATQQNAIAVSLKILYAKENFTIGVAQGTENQGTGTFTMNSLSVYNAALTTDIAAETFADANSTYTESGTTVAAKDDGTYTFYVAENRYNPGDDLTGVYPSDAWLTNVPADDVKNYVQGTDDDKLNGVKYFYDDLIQQYKPKLATIGEGGEATYALINGVYTDYRGTAWNVKYKIYLGKDNAMNFEVDRNSEYTNTVTIKGIRNNDSYGEDAVWIDHRVNVSTDDLSGNVTITRETLIDSHIEVRPLRVKWEEGKYDGVRVYLPTDSNGNLISWIGIERFTGENNGDGSVYCYAGGKSTGKRKYFTTTLISELQSKGGEFGVQTDGGRKFIYLKNNECAWIYFDENASSNDRQANITLEFYTSSGSIHSETYLIKQRGLTSLGGYAIESYEEYLHTYDSADKYNLSTSPVDYTQQGLAWGFQDTKISRNVIVNATDVPTSVLKDAIVETYSYDYFHESDGSTFRLFTNETGSWTDASFGTGLIFTNRASANLGITIKDMGTMPGNAYQYCLSKNKFEEDPDGNHTLDIHWYLPDVYELQSILNAAKTNNNSADLNISSYYWSSQPAIGSKIDIEILGTKLSLKDEIKEKARAVSVNGISEISRGNQNRIRCVYSAEAIKADMSDRIPDGIGGNFTFWMKAWNGSSEGYFKYMLPAAQSKPTSSSRELNDTFGYDETTDSYPYPTSANSSASTEFPYRQYQKSDGGWIGGFDVNPGLKTNWDETLADYYSTLNTYPGLSKYVTQKGVSSARSETSTEKKDVLTTEDLSTIVLNQTLSSNTNLNHLDHVSGGTMLNISFSTATNGNNSTFVYDENVNESKTVVTRYWEPPVYTNQSYNLLPKESTATGTDTGSEINTNVTTSKDEARQNAFNRAYEEAKDNALNKLNDYVANLNSTDPGWEISGSVDYTPLAWNTIPTSSYSNEFSMYVLFVGNCWSSTCTVSVTATAKIVKSSSVSLYNISREGYWRSSTETTNSSGVINTDELRFNCGNSFTITCTDSNYEITNVKVHYKGSNLVKSGIMGDGILNLRQTDVYARFIENDIYNGLLQDDGLVMEQDVSMIGSTETLQIPEMDYSADVTSGNTEGWQQWSGDGRSTVTLRLIDYAKVNNVVYNTYRYQTAKTDLSKYIIVDRIEVKCTKKKTASN